VNDVSLPNCWISAPWKPAASIVLRRSPTLGLRELGLHERAAGELDAPIQAVMHAEEDQPRGDERHGDADGDAPRLDEVVLGVVKDAQHGGP